MNDKPIRGNTRHADMMRGQLKRQNEKAKVMKQRITVEQLDELNNEQKERLREWWNPREGDWLNNETLLYGEPGTWHNIKERYIPLLSIGQMIQFLRGHYNAQQWTLGDVVADIDTYKPDELCDALWEDVKKVI